MISTSRCLVKSPWAIVSHRGHSTIQKRQPFSLFIVITGFMGFSPLLLSRRIQVATDIKVHLQMELSEMDRQRKVTMLLCPYLSKGWAFGFSRPGTWRLGMVCIVVLTLQNWLWGKRAGLHRRKLSTLSVLEKDYFAFLSLFWIIVRRNPRRTCKKPQRERRGGSLHAKKNSYDV